MELLVYIWEKDSCCGNTDRNYNNYDYDYNNNFGGDSSPENKMCTKDNLGKKEFEYNIIQRKSIDLEQNISEKVEVSKFRPTNICYYMPHCHKKKICSDAASISAWT